MAAMYLNFFRYSWVRGITTSQMNVQVATKNGFRLKKSSMEIKIDSILILSETCSVGTEAVSAANEGKGTVSAINKRKEAILKIEGRVWKCCRRWVAGIFRKEVPLSIEMWHLSGFERWVAEVMIKEAVLKIETRFWKVVGRWVVGILKKKILLTIERRF